MKRRNVETSKRRNVIPAQAGIQGSSSRGALSLGRRHPVGDDVAIHFDVSTFRRFDLLLAQADLLLLLGDVLRVPGEARLPSPIEAAPLLDAACANDELSEQLLALLHGAQKTPQVAWSDEYHRLFEGPIACPINETTYVRRDKGSIIADICGFYRAFGFEPAPDTGEKPDHLRCELEFMAMLLVMLAQAMHQKRTEQAQITRDAISKFAADHVAEWLSSFCERLSSVTSLAVYGRLSEVLPLAWQSLADVLGLASLTSADPDAGEHDETEREEIECGLPGGKGEANLTVKGRAV